MKLKLKLKMANNGIYERAKGPVAVVEVASTVPYGWPHAAVLHAEAVCC